MMQSNPVARHLGAIVLLALCVAHASSAETPWLRSRTMFALSPTGGTAWAKTYYTQTAGQELMATKCVELQNDFYEDFQQAFSADNGKTWSPWESMGFSSTSTPQGVRHREPMANWVDPHNGRMIQFVLDGVMPNNTATDGYSHWTIHYRVSTNAGRSYAVDQQVIQAGNYTPDNPLQGVIVGQNAAMIGATTCLPIRTQQNKVLVPVQITRSAGGFFDSAVLVGTWNDERIGATDKTIRWNLSERVTIESTLSSRGLFEPTIAEMSTDQILMIMRGSNSGISADGRRWSSISSDGGQTWSTAAPWTYTDGSPFFSPSSCSQLIKHSNGKTYWIGNISPDNSNGNDPRYPLVIGEVDAESLLFVKDSVVTIDTVQAGDSGSLQLSNFIAREDRLTGDIVLDLTRYPGTADLPSGSYVYRIAIPAPEPSGLGLTASALTVVLGYMWRMRRRPGHGPKDD
jgi:hypothetical protein